MTPAERKFADIEGGLMRARCLVRLLRELCDGGNTTADTEVWGGMYIVACEAEDALKKATAIWTEGFKLAGGDT